MVVGGAADGGAADGSNKSAGKKTGRTHLCTLYSHWDHSGRDFAILMNSPFSDQILEEEIHESMIFSHDIYLEES